MEIKRQIKLFAITAVPLAAVGGFFALHNARAITAPQTLPLVVSSAPAVSAVTPPAPSVADNPGVLDEHRRFALGMIETGNDDREIGGAGEVSRYQIMPSVWRQYSDSSSFQNPEASLKVAQQYWSSLCIRFSQQAHRAPTDFDMYVLWNAGYSFYASRAFNPANLSVGERDRAQRFVNLVESGDN
jgi:hypothetical protein